MSNTHRSVSHNRRAARHQKKVQQSNRLLIAAIILIVGGLSAIFWMSSQTAAPRETTNSYGAPALAKQGGTVTDFTIGSLDGDPIALADYEGDLRQRCRTVATVWGKRPARIVFYLLGAATLVIMMVPYMLDVYRPVYALIVGLGVYPVLMYVLLRVTRERTGPQLEKLSQLMKYDFMIWFVAVLLGAAT